MLLRAKIHKLEVKAVADVEVPNLVKPEDTHDLVERRVRLRRVGDDALAVIANRFPNVVGNRPDDTAVRQYVAPPQRIARMVLLDEVRLQQDRLAAPDQASERIPVRRPEPVTIKFRLREAAAHGVIGVIARRAGLAKPILRHVASRVERRLVRVPRHGRPRDDHKRLSRRRHGLPRLDDVADVHSVKSTGVATIQSGALQLQKGHQGRFVAVLTW